LIDKIWWLEWIKFIGLYDEKETFIFSEFDNNDINNIETKVEMEENNAR
jgi:hypothetical protein